MRMFIYIKSILELYGFNGWNALQTLMNRSVGLIRIWQIVLRFIPYSYIYDLITSILTKMLQVRASFSKNEISISRDSYHGWKCPGDTRNQGTGNMNLNNFAEMLLKCVTELGRHLFSI